MMPRMRPTLGPRGTPASRGRRGLPALLAALPWLAARAALAADALPPSPPIAIERATVIDARRAELKSTDRALEGYSVEGTMVTALRDHGRVQKIEVVALGERGRVLLDFYWAKGALLAARERRIEYGDAIANIPASQPLKMSIAQDDTIEYANHGVARFIRNGVAQPAGGEATERAHELAALSRDFRRLMTTPAPATGCHWQCSGNGPAACQVFACR